MGYFKVIPTDNVKQIFGTLTSNKITEMSGGKIPQMTPQQAAGLMGSWVVETGKPGLQGLDVVERGNNNAGRGLSQYSHSRRPGYDAARQEAISQGIDPNSAQFQMKYFAEEYAGVHDPAPGKSLIGWTKVMENAPANMTPAQASKYYTGSAQSGTGYFRPSTPHYDQRANAADQIYGMYNKGTLSMPSESPANPYPSHIQGIPTTAVTKPVTGDSGGGNTFFGIPLPF